MKLPKTWEMKDGTRIKIKDMETSHLMFSIAMIEREFDEHKAALLGDMHFDTDNSYEMMKLMNINLENIPAYMALWKELDTRETTS